VAAALPTDSPRPFDAKMVEHLVGLMDQHQLAEISLVEGDRKIRLRKGAKPGKVAYVPAAVEPVVAAPTVVTAAAAAAAPAPAPAAASKKSYHEIKSPMVGTFYSKPGPDKPDYVSVGATVKPDTVICKLEAMKIFNDLLAETTGVIKECCVKNGDPVEFGTVLFRVDAA
jgi:acetyl-CoA carboxylase biotin carboxyl carrier protein